MADEILSHTEHYERKETIWIETKFGEEERKYFKMSKMDQRD